MKIVHVTSVHRWNDVRIYYKMCRSLVKAGHEVHLVAPTPAEGPLPDESDGVQLHFLSRRQGRIGRVLTTARDAARTALALAPDIVHFHDPELLPQFVILSGKHNTRVVYDVHEDHRVNVRDRSWAPAFLRPAIGWTVGQFEDRGAPGLSAIVAATPSIAQRFSRHRRVAVVQNFPEVDSVSEASVRSRTPRPGHFAYVGGLSAGRGIRELVSAVGRVGPPATLSLAGPWERPELPTMLRAQSEWSQVHECGFLSRREVFALLSESQAGLVVLQPLANHLESFPVKMFEYMLAGLPVIASDFPVWRSIIGGHHCGLLVDPTSVPEIVSAMRRIISAPEEAQAMGLRGRAAVLAQFNWELEFAKLLSLYHSLGN